MGFIIKADANIPYIKIYISDNDVQSGTNVTLWARPFPNYGFVRWSDGSISNPRTIIVTSDVSFTAEYQRITESNTAYQYRCYIKDQLNLTDKPKAFMVVDTFTIRRDLLTNATSTISVLQTVGNVNVGDVLVLYDPTGQNLYEGVINAINGKTFDCSQMASFYKGTWIYNVSPQDYLEHELAVLLTDYAGGKIYQSSYIDPLVKKRLEGITIDYVGSTTVSLPTDLDENGNPNMVSKDMEQFIYEIYEKYGIVFSFEINFSGANYVHIKIPSFNPIKVGNNMFAVKDLSTVTAVEETNRLIIFGQDKSYRATYVAKQNNTISSSPTSLANRFNLTNTAIVFSDDPLADLVANSLPSTMYNHKVTFTLIIKNFIYQFGDFNLGGVLNIYDGDDYYNSVLTGYEITKQSNQNITDVQFTCGKVRQKLTQLLTMNKIRR